MDLRLVIVDDQTLFRENLKLSIELLLPRAKVVGVAGDGKEALDTVRRTEPHVVLLDMCMPILNGVECIRGLRRIDSSVKIIVLTAFPDEEYLFDALRLGADGYLLKDIKPQDLVEAIKKVIVGELPISSQVTPKLIKEFSKHYNPNKVDSYTKLLGRLTERELEILGLIGIGKDNSEIANALYLAEGTVRNYVSSIYEKLDLKDRAQAVRCAIYGGLV